MHIEQPIFVVFKKIIYEAVIDAFTSVISFVFLWKFHILWYKKKKAIIVYSSASFLFFLAFEVMQLQKEHQ